MRFNFKQSDNLNESKMLKKKYEYIGIHWTWTITFKYTVSRYSENNMGFLIVSTVLI